MSTDTALRPGFSVTISEDGESTATYVSKGGALVTVQETHPNFARIVKAIYDGEDPDQHIDLTEALRALTGKVTVENGLVKYEGEPIHNSVSKTILRYQREGRDFSGLVRFLERLQKNPSRHSREQLYTWLERQELAVTPDGCFLAFKGVNDAEKNFYDDEDDTDEVFQPYVFSDSLEGTSWDGDAKVYQSASQGTAFVDGVKFEGYIPNFVGAIVSMDRRDVDDDFSQDCSYGLHVGSFRYASGFARHLLEVKVAPEDVVSVPKYDTNKLRTCRYEVLAVQEAKVDDVSHWEAEATFDEDDAIEDVLSESNVPSSWISRLLGRRRNPQGEEG